MRLVMKTRLKALERQAQIGKRAASRGSSKLERSASHTNFVSLREQDQLPNTVSSL